MSARGLMRIEFACNDPDNGQFAGRVFGASWGENEIECGDWFKGLAFAEQGSRIRIERKWFEFERRKDWFGNWCWNAYWMKPLEGKRLIRHLRSTGRWHCTGGISNFYDWFNPHERDPSHDR